MSFTRTGTKGGLRWGALACVMLLGGCLSGENASGVGGGSSSIDPSGAAVGGVGTGAIAQSSIAYFSEVVGDRVFFETDQSTLTPQATAILDAQASWLTQYPTGTIRVEGHADEQGTRQYNLELSTRRAAAVRDYLVSRGVPDTRLSIEGFGKERPIETCSEERCWSQNRRAVTVVTQTVGS